MNSTNYIDVQMADALQVHNRSEKSAIVLSALLVNTL